MTKLRAPEDKDKKDKHEHKEDEHQHKVDIKVVNQRVNQLKIQMA